MQKSSTRKFHPFAYLLLLSLLCIFFDFPVTVSAKTLPWASNKSYDCINECIDKRYVFCSEAKFGFCCDPRQCGDQTGFCSGQNSNIGARYLACHTDSYCGERVHTANTIQKPLDGAQAMITIDDESFSPRSACIYEFRFPSTAMAGDVLVVRVNDTTRLDIHYAEGAEEQSAKGNFVLSPHWGHFQVRYPNSLFLTLRNNDAIKMKLDKPIRIDYWQELFNPQGGKQRDELTEPITPTFGLDMKDLITPKPGSSLDPSSGDDSDGIWLWLSFTVALLAVAGVGIGYYIMR